MKKYIPILLFAIVPLFYACVSRQQANYMTATTAISAINNGQSWRAALTDTLTADSMLLHARLKLNLLRIKFPVSGSSYSLNANNGQYFILDNSGKVTKTFKLDKNYPNRVTSIVNNTISSINKFVTGQFKVRFVIDSSGVNTDTTGTDTVTLTNGQFVAPYK